MKRNLNIFKCYILKVIIIILGGLLCAGLCLSLLFSNIDKILFGSILEGILYVIFSPSTFFLYLWDDVWRLPPNGDAGFWMFIIVPVIQFFLMGALLTWWIYHRFKKNQKKHQTEENDFSNDEET